MNQLKEFIDCWYPKVFMAVARLTGLSDKEALATVTENVLARLWDNRRQLAVEPRQGVFIYRLVLQEVISFLRQHGDEQRIRILRDIVLIDPALFLSDPPREDI
jgi:DNA-directed RNA polymerase specialized sigma24 family protein